MNFDYLKDADLQEKLSQATNVGEMVALAKEAGVALTDDQLEAVSGGAWNGSDDEGERYATNCLTCKKIITWYDSQGDPKQCPYCGTPLYFAS